MTMLTPVLDAPFSLPNGGGANGMQPWVVQNYDMRYHGLLPVAMALGNSLNVAAVKVELATGIPDIVTKARSMGITTLNQPPRSYTPSLTLGGYAVPLWEMAQAATALANQGQLHPARFVLSVKDGGGKELPSAARAPKQVLAPGTAFIMNQILSDDANRVIGFGAGSALTLPGHVVSAKTGTTSDFKDNLTIGWTPRLITATWIGNADNHAMRGTTGVTGAAPIWHGFMQQALNGKPDNWPGPPADVEPADYQGHHGFILKGTSVNATPDLHPGSVGGMKRSDDGVCLPWAQLENGLRVAGYRGPFDHGPAMKTAYERASHITLTPC